MEDIVMLRLCSSCKQSYYAKDVHVIPPFNKYLCTGCLIKMAKRRLGCVCCGKEIEITVLCDACIERLA